MNANELADEVEMWGRDLLALNMRGGIPVIEGARLLRQQALEIQALHQILGYEGVEVGQDYLDECVADLRKAQEK